MQAILQTGTEKVKFYVSDDAAITITDEQVEVRNPLFTDPDDPAYYNENFDIGDLNSSNCEIITNFPAVPADFKPDVYKYNKVSKQFRLNVDHPKHDEILAAQGV